MLEIERLHTVEETIGELSELLVRVVDGGASINFLPPLDIAEAEEYWKRVLEPGVILYIAKVEGRIAGTVQLQLCVKPNGKHRAEVAKLMTHPDFRRRGIARRLMQEVEARGRAEGRTLLTLDTREGDPSNLLYASLGYIQAGRIPQFALSANGELDATILYYKLLS
ncbi:GNAT family N-acetyltransferase [Paenibacillus humicola]|uniref:GNAT family N-acetyltransferase n=1 Tax=Paenibacillus humicola TaxID=3110540 RepID=UPI00237B05B9|nr:GNAT family N-acetyltransferase [Paenibacillus humicola]